MKILSEGEILLLKMFKTKRDLNKEKINYAFILKKTKGLNCLKLVNKKIYGFGIGSQSI